MTNIRSFENNAEKYDDWFIKNKYAYYSELKAISILLPKDGFGVEIGVGTGRFASKFGITLGVEPSKLMADFAKNRGIAVVIGVAENLPLIKKQFDYVLMVTTICFLDDIKKSFNEVYRILKPNSLFVLGFIDKNSSIGRLYQKNKDKSKFYQNALFYSVDEVIYYLKKTGFKDLTFYQTLFRNPENLSEIDSVRKDCGEGSFVVVGGYK